MLIEVSKLTKSYRIDDDKTQEVLRGMSFSIGKGELVAVVGESGSGKSTLLNIIGGLDSDFVGSVKISGKSLKEYKRKELDDYRKLKLGFIFQSFNLIPTYTVMENILTPANMTNMPEKQKKEKAQALISKLGLSKLQNKRPAFLSGGEKQRVAIARALMNDPDIILADEPTGALDKDNAATIISLLKEIAAEGKTVIVVTHSTTVAEHCDRIIRMEYGVISEDSGAKEVKPQSEKKEKLLSRKLSYIRSLSAAFKNIKKNKSRNILVSLGTGIGIFSVVILLFLSKGIGGYVEEQMYAGNDPLLIEVTKASESGRRLASLAQSEPFSVSELAQIEEIEGIDSIEKGSHLTGSASFSADDINGSLAVLSTINSNFSPDIKTGIMPREGEILINEAVAGSIS